MSRLIEQHQADLGIFGQLVKDQVFASGSGNIEKLLFSVFLFMSASGSGSEALT